ncbi:MAG: septum formation family protein [Nocardioidaceae bacterium]|nr:septum formation family protein [Nocardioidaceae bacterium]
MNTSRVRTGPLLLVVGALVGVLAACGSAADLAGQSEPTSEATSATESPTVSPTASPTESPTSPASPTTPEPTAEPTPAVDRPSPGQCRKVNRFDATLRVIATDNAGVPCSRGHNAQTYKVTKMSARVKKAVNADNSKQIYLAARGSCDGALPNWLRVGEETQQMSQFEFIVGVPGSTDISAGANWVRCDVVLRNGRTQLAALPRTTKGALNGAKGRKYQSCIRAANIANAFNGSFTCQQRHNWRAVSAFRLGGQNKSYTSSARLTARARSRCSADVRDYLNTTLSFQYGYILPTQELWKYGDRFGVCFAQTTN